MDAISLPKNIYSYGLIIKIVFNLYHTCFISIEYNDFLVGLISRLKLKKIRIG